LSYDSIAGCTQCRRTSHWPDDPGGFFEAIGSTRERELARYDAVIFFETAAAGGISVEGGNPTRIESNEEALALDRRLRDLWSGSFPACPSSKASSHSCGDDATTGEPAFLAA